MSNLEIIASLCNMLGVVASNKLTQYRIARLEDKVSKHNSIVERTYKLEGVVTALMTDTLIEEV